MDEHTVIADYSCVGDCVLDEYAQLQRRFTYTGRNTVIWHAEIGAFCLISRNVSIGGADYNPDHITPDLFYTMIRILA